MKTPMTPTACSGAELPKAMNVAPANQFTGNLGKYVIVAIKIDCKLVSLKHVLFSWSNHLDQ